MTFPKIELLCPQCKEPMTLINHKGEIKDCDVKGYDKMVEYHFQCKANERHEGKWHKWSMKLHMDVLYKGEIRTNGEPKEINADNCQQFSKVSNWCGISTEKEIAVFRILIPKIGNGNYFNSESTTQTEACPSTLQKQYKKQMEKQ
ncbi:unnamed protein product [marine sediment metagenome]|uniref:Uncharacterized protein n=1 Tax=marine sediment metagenome TaxID=412755 RepID=X1LRH4_9ZZZZ